MRFKILLFLLLFGLLAGTASASITYSNGQITISGQTATPSDIYSAVKNTAVFNRVGTTSTLTANIYVSPGATLNIINEKFVINCGSDCQYSISNTGNLNIINSTVTTTNPSYRSFIHTYFEDYQSVQYSMNIINSNISNMGSNAQARYGMYLGGQATFVDMSDPINRPNSPCVIKDSTFSNFQYGILQTYFFGALPYGYLTIQNNTFNNVISTQSGNGGLIYCSPGVNVLGNRFTNIYDHCQVILTSGQPNLNFSGNYFYNCTGSDVIIESKHANNITICNNYFTNCDGCAIDSYKGDSAQGNMAYGDVICGNTIKNHNAYAGAYIGSIALQYPGITSSIVRNNTLENVKGIGFYMLGSHDLILTNNTLKNVSMGGYLFGSALYRGTTWYPDNISISSSTESDCGRWIYLSSQVTNSTFRDCTFTNCGNGYMNGNFNNGFINCKNDNWAIQYNIAPTAPLKIYSYLDVLCLDQNSNPVSGASITVTNTVDPTYPAIFFNYLTASGIKTGSNGHTPYPSATNSIAILDNYTTSTNYVANAPVEMLYDISAAYGNSTAKVFNVNPNSSWYRSTADTPIATIKLVLNTSTPSTSSATYPTADFSTNVSSGYAPLSVQFTDLSKNATGWNWKFGDGTYSTQQNPIHIYSVAGAYTVNLTASNANGTNSKLSTITVSGPVSQSGLVLPTANFSSNISSGSAPLSVQFKDLSKNANGWNWNFGDGTYSTQQDPIHIYSAVGTFTVNLTASNANGTNSKTSQINATPAQQKIIAAFSASPVSGYAPLSVAFADKSTGSPTSWSWDFGDKSTSTAKNPVHTYTKAGKYTVSLIVRNAAGSNTTTKSNFIVVNVLKPPLAAFSASPISGKAPLSVTFTDKSTGSITSWSWNFGDKSTSTAKSPTHKYTRAGKYTVTLTVKNAAGSNTAKKTNYITVK